jgi:hypothetical protein
MGGSKGFAPLFGVYIGTERGAESSVAATIQEGDEVVVCSYREPISRLKECVHFISEVFYVQASVQL